MDQPKRFTQTVYALTSRVFRCGGLAAPTEAMDSWGRIDFYVLAIFGVTLAGWYTFLFQPEQNRNEMLSARLGVLHAQLKVEEVQLGRLRRGIHALESGDTRAWERAARSKLGWIKPGELSDSELIHKTVAADLPRNWDWSMPENGNSPYKMALLRNRAQQAANRARPQLPPLLPQQSPNNNRPTLPPLNPYTLQTPGILVWNNQPPPPPRMTPLRPGIQPQPQPLRPTQPNQPSRPMVASMQGR